MQAEMYWKVLKSHIDFLQLLLSIPFNILNASRKAHKFQVPNTHNSYTCIYMYVTLTHIHIEKHMHVVYEVYAYLQYYICVLQVLIHIDIPWYSDVNAMA